MGLADVGIPLSHEDTMKWAPYVREHGILQFINLYKKQKDRYNDPFKWGDEIEYTLLKFNENEKEVKVSLTSFPVLEDIKEDEDNGLKMYGFWAPEYAAYMIEGTPAEPYEGLNFVEVERNMNKRRKELKRYLKNNEELVCITSYPRLGCEHFTYPNTEPTPNKGLTRSLFFPDAAIFPGHPRYGNTTKNVMGRRGEKSDYNVPILRDKNTKIPVDNCYRIEKNALSDHIYLDAMGFGSGYSCFQVTVQGSNIDEAKILYDQLIPFCPIMMALTAAAPFHRGFITDVDTRWKILCNTHDCRTEEERGLKPLKKNNFFIPKSRFGSVDCYISSSGEKYNDNPVVYYEEDYKKLVDNGVDSLLAKHIAHLFIRNTISLFEDKIHQNDETETGHFENIQSTNWQTVRFKPPPADGSIGWRVEFRPCDLQMTDFENAAVGSFLILLTRIILTYKLNFLLPISKVDENIERAQKRNAIKEQKFWFRRHISQTYDLNGNTYQENNNQENWSNKNVYNKTNGHAQHCVNPEIRNNNSNNKVVNSVNSHNGDISNNKDNINGNLNKGKLHWNSINSCLNSNGNCCINGTNGTKDEDEWIEMTVDEIINGKEGDFPGVIPLMHKYLNNIELDDENSLKIKQYLKLIGGRASGEILTTAAWMRKFVMDHPNYRHDSVITEEINYDLFKTMKKLESGALSCPELLGEN